MKTIIGFLPLRIGTGADNRNYENNIWRTKLLIKSLEKYLNDPLEIAMVCVASEMPQLRAEISGTSKITLTWLDQENIVPGITDSAGRGWYKQQVLCIAFAATQTKPILKLDPDMFLIKSLSETDLWRDGKLATDWLPKKTGDMRFKGSATLLDIPVNYTTPGMLDTPFTMVPAVAARCIDELKFRDISLLDLAKKIVWTEVAFYSVVADIMTSNGIMEYHFQSSLHGSICRTFRDLTKFKINPKLGSFVTIQGVIGLSEDETLAIIGNLN